MRFTVPRLQAKATVNRVQTNAEMCNQLVSWAAGLGDASTRPCSLAIYLL